MAARKIVHKLVWSAIPGGERKKNQKGGRSIKNGGKGQVWKEAVTLMTTFNPVKEETLGGGTQDLGSLFMKKNGYRRKSGKGYVFMNHSHAR